MSISQMMIAGSSNSRPPKVVTWYGIALEPINEGQQQTITLLFAHWDNSAVYWTLVEAGSSASLNSRVVGGQANGTIYPGNGDSSQTINFTFSADATTEGTTYYVVRVGSTPGGNEYINNGNYTLRDSSQTPALVLDVDPASLGTMFGLTGWTDASGQGNNISVVGGTKSTDNGGTLVFNGSTTYAGDLMNANLTNSVYGTITLSAWIKPTAVTGRNQTIIAKELCYKLRINGDGTTTMSTGKGNAGWEVTATADAGAVTAGAWAHLVATSDTDYTRIYVNGVKVAETSGNIIGANTNQFDIGSYNSVNDLFAGSMGEVKVWNYAITEATIIEQYNATANRYGRSVIPLSLDFPGTGNPYLLVQNTQSDWNLGTTYTIEFWSKGGNASNGTIRTVASQGPGNGIDIGYAYGHLLYRNTEPAYPEPTPGAWTHVAYVGEGDGYIKLYYNGVYQTNFAAGGLIDGGSDLDIGRRAGVNGQGFYGKLAMIRISNTAKYTSSFTPSYSYGVEGDTKLLLSNNPTVDGTGNHPISNSNVGLSTDFPSYQSLVFNQPEGDYLVTPASSDWNLENIWTMEFWINANNASNSGIHIPGGQWGLIDQGGWYGGRPNNTALIGLTGGYLTIAQDTNTDIQFAEPTPGVWTHVAVVNNGGGAAQKVYYNGVEQTKTSGTYQSNGWTNTEADLYIGRLSNHYGGYASHFDGKMAMIRISNTAKYLNTFTSTTSYGVESDTVLFLGKITPLNDSKSHSITNNGVTTAEFNL